MAIERLQVPSGGINTEASPDYIPLKQAQGITNLLPGQGKLYMRGPFTRQVVLGAAAATPAIWTSDNKALIKSSAHYVLDGVAATAATIAPARTALDSRHARVGDFVYGSISPTLGTTRDLGKWNPAAGTIVAVTNAPVDFTDLKQHKNRLFSLGGSVPGTTTPVKQYSLFCTDPINAPNGPNAGTLAEWQDFASGLTNQIVYASSDVPVALARCGRALAILMRRSIYLLTGDGMSSFAVRLVASNVGCLDRNSVSESDEGCYFLSANGFCYFDGTSVEVLSRDVTSRMYGASATYSMPLPRDFVLVYGNGGNMPVLTCMLYNRVLQAWIDVTSDAVGMFIPVRLADYDFVYDGQNAWDASTLVTPELATTPGLDDTSVSTDHGIRCSYTTRVARLASPETQSQLRRLMLDYCLNVPGGMTIDTSLGANSTVFGKSISGSTTLDASIATGIQRQRAYVESYTADVHNVSLTVVAGPPVFGPTNRMSAFEIYDGWVEYDAGQNRGNTR